MILRAAWVLPITALPIRNGYVHIENERIVAVGPANELPRSEESVSDLGDVALLPGLVNPHCHLELTCYAGRLKPAPLWEWFAQLVPLRAQPGQAAIERDSVIVGAWQSLRAGVTCVGDIARRPENFAASCDVPIRKVAFVELLALADDPPRNVNEVCDALDRLPRDPLLTLGVTPHAPYTVSPDAIRATIALAAERNLPWCMHWSETREERLWIAGAADAMPAWLRPFLDQSQITPPGLAPGELLDRVSAGLLRGALAHCNYVTPTEMSALADAGHVVMYCPRSHAFFGHTAYPLRAFHDAGVLVAVATDSLASNTNLALLEELRHIHGSHPGPPPADGLLAMVTHVAARALRLDACLGALEPGKLADLTAFPLLSATDSPAADIISRAPAAAAVWIGGKQVI